MKQTIAIIGLGWLGKPLYQRLSLLGFTVKGAVTTTAKASKLQAAGMDAYPVHVTEEGVLGNPEGFLKNVHTLIIMIPPGLRRNSGADYVLKMSHLITAIQQSEVTQLIYVSSTSVYSDTQGNVTEKDLPQPDTEAGRQLYQVEQLFFNIPGITTTILRFGGLIGGNRMPVRYLAGRTDLSDGEAPVNLIHRDDCLSIISGIILQSHYGHIINAVHPQHPTKKDYYTTQAKALGITPPQFSEPEGKVPHKQVDSLQLETLLKYQFKKDL